MQKNVGGLDRRARLVAGPVLILVALAGFGGLLPVLTETAGLVVWALALVFGVVFVATGYTQKCVLNDLLGVDTSEGGAADTTGEAGSEPKA